MKKIKKEISIDKCRSHKNGLLPFVQYGTGNIVSGMSNYGHFVCDLSGNTGVIKYLDLIRRYNTSKNILNEGVLCKCIETKQNKKILKANDDVLFSINCGPEEDPNIFHYKPIDSSYFSIEDNGVYIPTNDDVKIKINKKYVLLNNINTYSDNETWGVNNRLSRTYDGYYSTLIQCVENDIIKTDNIKKNFNLVPPTVDIPILFEEEYVPDTIYFPYEYSVSGTELEIVSIDNESYSAVVGTNIMEYTKIYSAYSSTTKEDEIITESKIKQLNHHSAFNVTNEHFGIMERFHDDNTVGELFKCIYYTELNPNIPRLRNTNAYQVFDVTVDDFPNVKKWWECVKISNEDKAYTCGDGEELEGREDEKKYRNITTLSCIPSYIPNPKLGNVYYFYTEFQNGKIKPFNTIDTYSEVKKISFPFKVGEPVNIERYDSDMVYDMVISADVKTYISPITSGETAYCDLTYVLGATSGSSNDTGIYYKERLEYISGVTQNAWVDGCLIAELYYQKLNYDTNLEFVYNETYYIDLEVRPATIFKMTVGSTMVDCPDHMSFTKEGTENLYFEPKIETDVIFDRGIGAGWEKHFKLAECNTFQDLKNYGNNVFNL